MLTGVDGVEWSGVDTPQTVMTTRAPAVLKTSATYEKQHFGCAHKNDQLIGHLHILYEKAENGEVFYKFK